jgi:hypothetical protein
MSSNQDQKRRNNVLAGLMQKLTIQPPIDTKTTTTRTTNDPTKLDHDPNDSVYCTARVIRKVMRSTPGGRALIERAYDGAKGTEALESSPLVLRAMRACRDEVGHARFSVRVGDALAMVRKGSPDNGLDVACLRESIACIWDAVARHPGQSLEETLVREHDAQIRILAKRGRPLEAYVLAYKVREPVEKFGVLASSLAAAKVLWNEHGTSAALRHVCTTCDLWGALDLASKKPDAWYQGLALEYLGHMARTDDVPPWAAAILARKVRGCLRTLAEDAVADLSGYLYWTRTGEVTHRAVRYATEKAKGDVIRLLRPGNHNINNNNGSDHRDDDAASAAWKAALWAIGIMAACELEKNRKAGPNPKKTQPREKRTAYYVQMPPTQDPMVAHLLGLVFRDTDELARALSGMKNLSISQTLAQLMRIKPHSLS